MADKTADRQIKTVAALQNVASLVLRAYDETRRAKDQYLADGGNAAFDATFFTNNSTSLGLTLSQFVELRDIVLAFIAWAEEAGQDRIARLARARLVG